MSLSKDNKDEANSKIINTEFDLPSPVVRRETTNTDLSKAILRDMLP